MAWRMLSSFPDRFTRLPTLGQKDPLFEHREQLDALVEKLLNLRASAKFPWPIPEIRERASACHRSR